MDMNRMPSHPRLLAALLGFVACFFVAGTAQGQDTLSTTWAGNLGGGASEGFQVTAGCALQSFDIVLDITAPGSNWAGDMAMAVTAPNGNRIEIGGYNLGFGYVEAGPWPSSWNTSADGIFTASITDLAQYELAGAGCWLVEIMNAWNTGAVSEYALSLDLIGLCDEGDAPGCIDPGALNYNACALSDDGSCIYPPLSAGFTWVSTCGLPEMATFEDISLGNVVTYAWSFESGDPASSDAAAPMVTWDTPGSYEVTLTVGDGTGSTSTFMDVITAGENLHRLEIDITPDAFPQETSFAVLNANGDTLHSGGVEGLDACVPDECLSVWLMDSGADGFSVGGTYQIRFDGNLLRDGEHFDAAQLTLAGCPVGSSCDDPLSLVLDSELEGPQGFLSPSADSWYVFEVDTTGQYRFATCGVTGCDTRIHLYDYCDMAIFETSSEAFITMSDDDCDLQSIVTPILIAGETIYMRLEGDGSCNGGNEGVPFEAEFLGGIPGCMNIEACNYLPIATSPDTCYLAGDPECPNIGPDLIINGPRAYSTLELTTENRHIMRYAHHLSTMAKSRRSY